jgi:hypothetical protein
MQRNRDEKLYVTVKITRLKGGIGQKRQNMSMFRLSVLERQDQLLQALAVHPRTGDPVEMNLFALAIGTCSFNDGKSTGLPAATPAIFGPRAHQKPIPAILAQIVIRFTNTLATIRTHGRPKKLMKALQGKTAHSFQKRGSMSGSCRIHVDDYTENGSS